MYKQSLVIFVLTFAYVSAEFVTTYPCPNVTNTHTYDITMEVTDCKASDERCPLFQGKTHSVIFRYTTDKNYTGKSYFRVYGVFKNFNVPYGMKSDAFDNANYIDNNESVKDVGMFIANRPIQHNSDFAVSASYPKLQLRVRFTIITKREKELIMCRELPVEIMSPVQA